MFINGISKYRFESISSNTGNHHLYSSIKQQKVAKLEVVIYQIIIVSARFQELLLELVAKMAVTIADFIV